MNKLKAILAAIWAAITAAAGVVIALLVSKNKNQKDQIASLEKENSELEKRSDLQLEFDFVQRDENEKKQTNLDSLANGTPISNIMSELREQSKNRVRPNNK